jgi:hypothetical protein
MITFPQDQIDETIKRLHLYSEFFKGSPNQDTRIYAWARFSARGSRIINQQQQHIKLLEEKLDELQSLQNI